MDTHYLFTTRQGGASDKPFDSFNLGDHVGDNPRAVAENRQKLAQQCNLEYSQLVFMEQTHSAAVAIIDESNLESLCSPIPHVDAMVTTRPQVGLCVLTADCVPVILWDQHHQVIAVAHAGRRGAAAGIIPNTVLAMEQVGGRRENIHVLLGPAISGSNYEVPEQLAHQVERSLPGSCCRTTAGTFGLDIRAGLSQQLRQLGINQLTISSVCTYADENYFSYRRDGLTGRLAGVVWMTN